MAKKAMTIVIDREEDAMTISVAPPKGKGITFYETAYGKISKGVAKVMIQSYIWRDAVGDGASVFVDEQLKGEISAISESPYLGEFKLFYVGKQGEQIPAVVPAVSEGVDETQRHVRIVMYGDKTAMFDVFVNDELSNYKIFGKSRVAKKDIDNWIVSLYRNRRRYPNLTFEMPRLVAGWLDTLCCNPRIIDGLHMTLTETPPNYNVQDLYATA